MADLPEIPPQYSKEALENAERLLQLDKDRATLTGDQASAIQGLRDEYGSLESAVQEINRERGKLNASEAESITNLDKINRLHKELAGTQAEQAAIAKENLALEQKKLDYLIQQASLDGVITDEEKEQIEAQTE